MKILKRIKMKEFTLEVSITEKCNLGCPYCYVANKNTFMTEEMFDNSIPMLKNLMERAGATELSISYFGGEPMINFPMIQYINKRLKEEFGKNFTKSIILSNMTLLDEEKLAWIKENNVNCSWSFDGISSNESRPLLPTLENKNKDGKAYANIMEMYGDNIHLIKEIVQGCKTMIWPGNMAQMVENYQYFVEMGIDPDFSLVRDDVWTKEDLIAFRGYMKDLTKVYKQSIIDGNYQIIGFYKLYLLDAIQGLTKGKRPYGCFAGTSGAVLMSSGEFYPCARFASKKLNLIDENYSFQYWNEQFNPKNYDKCQTCDIKLVCNAGCNFSQLRNDNKPVDSVCELFHIIYEEVMSLTHDLKDNKNYQKMVQELIKGMYND